MQKMRVLITAGGTGGHVFPALALAERLQERSLELLFAGGGLGGNRYFPKEQFPFQDISSSAFQRNLFKLSWTLGKGIVESLSLLKSFRPDVVVGFGSFHTFPVLAAALLSRIPIVLHEANAFPGKVVRLFSPFAKATGLHLAEAACHLRGRTVEVGIPLRSALSIENAPSREEALHYFGLTDTRRTLFVFGGSQGAKGLNRSVEEAIPFLDGFQVIHMTGSTEQSERFRALYSLAGIPACVKNFESKMAYAWRAADIVVGRSGASTVAEAVEFEVPSILIPYPHAADDHQLKNALFLEKMGAACYLPEAGLTGDALGLLIQQPHESFIEKLRAYKQQRPKKDLADLVWEVLACKAKSGT